MGEIKNIKNIVKKKWTEPSVRMLVTKKLDLACWQFCVFAVRCAPMPCTMRHHAARKPSQNSVESLPIVCKRTGTAYFESWMTFFQILAVQQEPTGTFLLLHQPAATNQLADGTLHLGTLVPYLLLLCSTTTSRAIYYCPSQRLSQAIMRGGGVRTKGNS